MVVTLHSVVDQRRRRVTLEVLEVQVRNRGGQMVLWKS